MASQPQPRHENDGKEADFCGTKEKREENETMISMGKKANAFFFPGSHFLFLSFFPHDFHRKRKRGIQMKHILLLVLVGLLLVGCSSSKPTLPRDNSGTMVANRKINEEKASPAFQVGDWISYGSKDRLGITKQNEDKTVLFTTQQRGLGYAW
jgi:hypothetical protein